MFFRRHLFFCFWCTVSGCWVWQIYKRPLITGFLPKLGFWVFRVLGFGGFMLGLFFWIWGFNYKRVPLPEQMGLTVVPLDTAALWDELQLETHALDSLRTLINQNDTTALNNTIHWPEKAEDTVRLAVCTWLVKNNFPVTGRVRGRILRPAGILQLFNAAGLYWPFVGEGHVDAGLHPLQTLPVMAHEMSHGYGFGDEGVCNFIAYAACYNHPNPYLAYASRLSYWRTVAANCVRSDPKRYQESYRPFIPPGIRQDVRAIEAQMDKYKELMPRVRYQVYDAYLKSQGIEAGMLK